MSISTEDVASNPENNTGVACSYAVVWWRCSQTKTSNKAQQTRNILPLPYHILASPIVLSFAREQWWQNVTRYYHSSLAWASRSASLRTSTARCQTPA